MNTILQINTSLFGEQRPVLAARGRVRRGPGRPRPAATSIVRDLARDPVPHLTAERFTAFTTPASERTLEQQRHVAESDALIDELRAPDVVVLGLPMYNFGVPSTLKAYFDHVARAGVTFRYTAEGPVGLLTGKKAVRVRDARRPPRRHGERPADRVRAPVPRLRRHPRRRVRLCRGPRARRRSSADAGACRAASARIGQLAA